MERSDAPTVREGLPPNYRMRADRHYIDHLESRSSTGLEWLDPALIESAPAGDDSQLGELVDSIRRHGVLQPLLVQHRDGQYRLISGLKRRRAAMLAGLRRVPCALHEVDDEGARALAAAAKVRAPQAPPPAPPQPVDATSDVARSLETLSFCSTLLSGGSSDLSRGISADLIGAEAWRTLCVVEAGRIVQQGPSQVRKLVSPRAVVGRIERSFQAECRLRNVSLEVDNQIPEGRLVLADETQLAVAVSGAIIATMALLDRAGRASLRLTASATAGEASLAVAQSAVVVPDSWASRAFDAEWADRPGGSTALVSMLALKSVAEASSGSASVGASRRGTNVTVTIPMA